jgi:hypothetical protein
MKIIIGAGDERVDGYVTLDYDEKLNPDYIIDLEKDKLPFDDNTVETVLAHHIFEHLGEGFFHCVKELYRVCKHGAIIDVKVPHPKHWTFIADPTHRRPILPETFQLFSKKYNVWLKENNHASTRLAEHYDVDFELLSVDEIPLDFYKTEFEGKPVDYVKRYLEEHNNIIFEIHFRLVVIKEYNE